MLLVRIFTVDFYMSSPIQGLDSVYSDFRGSSIHNVPVIRIFGSSDKGYKTCLHIHGVFPYIYIPFEGSENAGSVMYQIAGKLDQAINTAIGQASSSAQHIYKISLVSGIPLYGYHTREHQFLKIYFYNPLIMKKACNLLQNGNILGKVYQLHEAHIPFILQFMIDYNLHGMNFISLSQVRYRVNSESQEDIPPDLLLPRNIFRTSVCQIEADGLAEYIVNRLEVATGSITKNPGIAALWEDEKQRRKNNGQDSQISPCISQNRTNIVPTDSHNVFKEALMERLRVQNNQDYKVDPNASVYPAETPKSKNISSASLVEKHHSLTDNSTSFCSTSIENEKDFNMSNQSMLFNKTICNANMNESGAKDLLEILQDLGDNVTLEEDSVLSQISKYQEESDEENDIDMSLPLGAVTTPTKIIVEEKDYSYQDKERNNEHEICSQLIPQLDDAVDEDVPIKKKKKKDNDTSESYSSSICSSGSSCENEGLTNGILSQMIEHKTIHCDAVAQNDVLNFAVDDFSHTISETDSDRVKRKLNFTDMVVPNITVIEENCECRYVPVNFRKPVIHRVEDKVTIKRGYAEENISKHLSCEKLNDAINKSNNANNNTEFINISHTDPSKNEIAVLKTKLIHKIKNNSSNNTLSKTEKYDVDKDYPSIAGTSKENNLIQNNECHKNCDISSSIKNEKVSSNGFKTCDLQSLSSDSLTPYQKCSGQTMYNTSGTDDCHNISGDEDLFCHSQVTPIKKNLLDKVKLTQSLSMFETTIAEKIVSLTSCGCYALMPKFNPPSKEMISKTLQEYDIPRVRYQKPFYSDYTHVTGEVQVGYNILKIGDLTSDLLEFECQNANPGLQQLQKLQLQKMQPNVEITNNKLKSIKLSFYEVGDCVITPSKLPPPHREVAFWIKAKSLQVKNDAVPKIPKLKILVPCSPGAQSDSEESIISISPFSPVDNKTHFTSGEDFQQTPRSSLKITLTSSSKKSQKSKRKLQRKTAQKKRILNGDDEFVEKKKNKISNTNDSDTTLRKTLLQSQFLNNLISPVEALRDSGQITAATLDNTHGFKMSLENLQKVKAVSEYQYLTLLVMELHIQTRLDFKPNPELDPIRAIFYSLVNDAPETSSINAKYTGVFVVDLFSDDSNKSRAHLLEGSGVTCNVIYVDSEVNLINEFVKFVRMKDPDIFAGYEIELLSWGYLIERSYVLGIHLPTLLARTQIKLNFSDDDTNSGLKLTGRILLDVWRLMRHEVALQSYTFENIVYHILHKRVPLYSFKDLSFWWEYNNPVYLHRTVNFYLYRVEGILELFERLDLIGRTSELARLFGIQFYEVLSRGSQFRVESMMLRLAKPLNYVAVSPSIQQRAKMKAPEFLPLILEPESKFFIDPVIVLDFQSLYPSIIIAYNYCFSTCLGRVEHLGQNAPFVFGATQFKVSNTVLKKLCRKDLINFSPCGVAFVKSKVREGILPRMLTEILDTRLMVKKSMKQNKDDKVLQRVLHSRQLGLKLIANVTYGYTAANFSGRMPAVEIADSVVSKGRETLLRAIKLIENTPHWGAKVVYGDTDSIFVLVPGRSRQCAFQIGAEIAEAVTNDNPSPVKLKLEKVYHPCILQTKKRYVGYMYESEDQTEPEFCAKGIETVRRDGCPAVSKMLEKCLKILFDTHDVSLVHKYVVRQFNKLLSGRVSLQDLIFAKEYRGASNYRPGACVPALELTRKWIAIDKRSEPRVGERVPYVIINGPPGLPLIKLVRSPRELLSDSNLIPNVLYYITRVIIPPLNRCFTLIGADLNTWFSSMPRKYIHIFIGTPDSTSKKRAISHYFSTTNCVACNRQTHQGLCIECRNSAQETLIVLQNKIRLLEKAFDETNLICQSCCGHPQSTGCISLDCPAMYGIIKTRENLQQVPYLQQVISATFDSEF